jgi:hypothetical protein
MTREGKADEAGWKPALRNGARCIVPLDKKVKTGTFRNEAVRQLAEWVVGRQVQWDFPAKKGTMYRAPT